MRFAYVAASAVVIGAAVSEARSVPSSPQRTPRSVKRQSRQADLPQIQPLVYTNSPLMIASSRKAKTFRLENEVDDGFGGAEIVSNVPNPWGPPSMPKQPSAGGTSASQPTEEQLTNAQAVSSIRELTGNGGMGGVDTMEIINVDPAGEPEHVVMDIARSQGEMASSNVSSAPRRYQPSPLASLAYIIETDGKSSPEPIYYIQHEGQAKPDQVDQLFKDFYTSAPFSPSESMPQMLPYSGETSTDAFNSAIALANGQSTSPSPMTLSNGPPPSPLFRASVNDLKLPVDSSTIVDPSEIIKPFDNNTMTPKEKKGPSNEFPVPANETSSSPQAPVPVFRASQIFTTSAATQNVTSLPVPSSLLEPSLPNPPSLPSNETAPSSDAKASTEDT